ncbi:MAG: TIGR02281 family clan AA aspartic protease [Candidatus Omnitrophica bacterium]|nr:TIGR02281 family clan AA aspartic protease [Candidatus Omnitrophota bacterium]
MSVLADTLFLKNGRNIEGVIVNKDSDNISIDVGGGVVDFSQEEVRTITYASSDENEGLYVRFEKRKKKLEKEEAAAQAAREKSLEAWRQNSAHQDALKKEWQNEQHRIDAATKVVPVTGYDGHLLIDASINAKASAVLVVDTGSPMVLLTSNFIEKLNFTLADLSNVHKITVLNGEHLAAYVILRSVKVGDVEEANVPAMILLEKDEAAEKGFKDGLLGLSYLSRFHVTFDQTNTRLLLRSETVQ